MLKTNLQNQIDTMLHVKELSNDFSTVHRTKHATYNRIFKADNFSKYIPNGKETKYELLVAYNIHVAITKYRLKKIGNMNSLELLNGVNHTVSLEDLQNEVLLKFVEFGNDWTITQDGKVQFLNDITMIELFKAVDNYLYRFQTKHYKHQYIEIDGEYIDVTKVTQLADYVSIEEIQNNVHFQTFYNAQTDNDRQWLNYRLQGLSNLKIANAMNVTYEKIRATEKRVRRNWIAYNEK